MKEKKNENIITGIFIIFICVILLIGGYIIYQQYNSIQETINMIEEEQNRQEVMWDYIIENADEFYEVYESGCDENGNCWSMSRLK